MSFGQSSGRLQELAPATLPNLKSVGISHYICMVLAWLSSRFCCWSELVQGGAPYMGCPDPGDSFPSWNRMALQEVPQRPTPSELVPLMPLLSADSHFVKGKSAQLHIFVKTDYLILVPSHCCSRQCSARAQSLDEWTKKSVGRKSSDFITPGHHIQIGAC